MKVEMDIAKEKENLFHTEKYIEKKTFGNYNLLQNEFTDFCRFPRGKMSCRSGYFINKHLIYFF